MKYVIGVDGGGTKTIALISDFQGRLLSVGFSGPSNYHIVGIENAKKAIAKAISNAISKAKIRNEQAHVACYGLAGLDSPKDIRTMKPHLESLNFSKKTIVVHDSHIALMGATAGSPGVIVIAGTGSVAAGIDEKGNYVRSGGWGPVIGDEGSAFYIAREGIVAALKYYDGRGAPTKLLEAILEELNLEAPEDIIGFIYTPVVDFSKIAKLAPLVAKIASEGDTVAQDILRSAGKELAKIAIAVIKRLGFEERSFPLAIIGGAFKAGEHLIKSFKSEVLKTAPNAVILRPRFPPVVGAIFIALKEAGVEISNEIINNIETSLTNVKI